MILDTPGELSPLCTIEEPSGFCGSCIIASCQLPLNGCCGDATCAPLLDTIDDCAEEYAEQYTYGPDTSVCLPLAELDTDPGSELKSCIAAACSQECGLGDIASEHSGSNCSDGYVNACECTGTGDDPGNLVECGPPPGGAVCCAYQAYPAIETHCSCSWFMCSPTADGCSCSSSNDGSADRCDGAVCCKDKYGAANCRCSDDPTHECDSIELEVPSCTPAQTIRCAAAETQVTSCSVRRDP